MILRRVVLVLMALVCLAVPAQAARTVPTTSIGSVAGYQYDGMGGPSFYFLLTGTLSFGTKTQAGSWFIGYAGDPTHAELWNWGTNTRIGTCVVADTMYGYDQPASAVITCLGHFDGQERDLPVALALVMPHAQPTTFDHGTGYEYRGRYAG